MPPPALDTLVSAVRHTVVWTLALAGSALAQSRDTVTYDVRFPNAVHHEAEITATFSGLAPGALELRMSRSSPGRYALHEFAKNVYSVRVTDGAGRPIEPDRPDPSGWSIRGHDGTVRVMYTLFADRADGTYSGVDRTHAHLNAPATFMYAPGLSARPVRVAFSAPEGSGWRVATQLGPTEDPFVFTAPDLDYLMDSPVEMADLRIREWRVNSGGREQTIRLAVHDPGSDEDVERFADMARKIAAAEAAVFGEYPEFDYGTYTFLACYGPWASGDGMEHRNSTSLTSTRALELNALGLAGTLSHEFFHAWNMERIRSAALEPFAYDRENMSDELWFGEGFTQYYTNLFLLRAGLIDESRYLGGLVGTLNAVIDGPGRRYRSPVEMSRLAPFTDAATSVDPTNFGNTFISYYTWGAAIGLGLDLTLRTRFGLTLDGFMRQMWSEHGRPFVPYSLADIQETLGEYAGDPAFAQEFFDRYVRGREVVDYGSLLAAAGVAVRPAAAGRATLGRSVLRLEGGAVVARAVYVGTPLYDAGVDVGDGLQSLDGESLTSVEQIEEILGRHNPGEEVELTFTSQGQSLAVTVTLAEDPTLDVLTYEEAELIPTEPMWRMRAEWLGPAGGAR